MRVKLSGRWLRYLLTTTGSLLLALVCFYLLIPVLLKPVLNLVLRPYSIQVEHLDLTRPLLDEWQIQNLQLRSPTFTSKLEKLGLSYDLRSLRKGRLITVNIGRVGVTLTNEPNTSLAKDSDSWVPQTLNPADWLGQLPWQHLQVQDLSLHAPHANLQLQGSIEQSASGLSGTLEVIEPQTIELDQIRFEYDQNSGVSLHLLNQDQPTPIAQLKGELQPTAVQWHLVVNLVPATTRTLASLLALPQVELVGEVTANGSLAWPPPAVLPWQELELTGKYSIAANWLDDGQDPEAVSAGAEPLQQVGSLSGSYELGDNRLALLIDRAALRYSAAGSQAQCSVESPLHVTVLEPAQPGQIDVGKGDNGESGLECHLSGEQGQLNLVLDHLSYVVADIAELKLGIDFTGQFGQHKPSGKLQLHLQQSSDTLVNGEGLVQLVSPLLLPPSGTAAKAVELPWTIQYQSVQDLLKLQFSHQVKLGERVLSAFGDPAPDSLDVSHGLLKYRGELQINPTTGEGLRFNASGDFSQLLLEQPAGTPEPTLRLRPLRGSAVVDLRDNNLRLSGDAKLAGIPVPFSIRYNMAKEQAAFEAKVDAELPKKFLHNTFSNWIEPLDVSDGRLKSQLQGGWKGDNPMQFTATLEHIDTAAHYEDYLLQGASGAWRVTLRDDNWRAQTERLTVGTLDVGLPITGFSSVVRVEVVDEMPTVEFENVQFALLGGQVFVPTAHYDPAHMPNRFEVSVQNISLAEILALEGEDISGTGQLSGTLPITVSAGGLKIDRGSLKSLPPGGTIRVADSFTHGTGQPGLDFALRALNNFTYSALQADVTYEESGDLNLGVTIKGHNPQVEAGRKIVYNLNINENVPALLQSLQVDQQVTKQVERQVNQREK